LRDVQALRGPADVFQFGDRRKILKQAQIHVSDLPCLNYSIFSL
jgi:hypothetical protein